MTVETREMAALGRKVDRLTRELATTRRLLDRLLASSVGRAVDGTPSQRWPSRFQAPDGTAYILRRAAGGNASFIAAAGVADSDWSDA